MTIKSIICIAILTFTAVGAQADDQDRKAMKACEKVLTVATKLPAPNVESIKKYNDRVQKQGLKCVEEAGKAVTPR